jgi:hypothetical protein
VQECFGKAHNISVYSSLSALPNGPWIAALMNTPMLIQHLSNEDRNAIACRLPKHATACGVRCTDRGQ